MDRERDPDQAHSLMQFSPGVDSLGHTKATYFIRQPTVILSLHNTSNLTLSWKHNNLDCIN